MYMYNSTYFMYIP